MALAVAVAATWALQPSVLQTLSFAALMLGLAMPLHERTDPSPTLRSALVGAAVVGSLVAGGLMFADVRLDRALASEDARAVESAAAWFPGDPAIARTTAQAWSAWGNDDLAVERVADWALETAERDPLWPR